MGLRVGIDLVSTACVRELLDEHGERYLRRMFTALELEQCSAGALDVRRLAGLVAAKEAAFKVLQPGRNDPTVWTDIEVQRTASGAVALRFNGTAAELARMTQITSLSVSVTHRRDTAAALVIAEHRDTDR